MISRIDHVALAVRDYDRALRFFTNLLGAVPGACADDPNMRYLWQLTSIGDLSRFELLTPTGDGSFLDGFLKDREGGIHHVTMQTPDIRAAKKTLEENRIPYFGFKDYGPIWKELFIHPRDAFGVLIQIAEFTAEAWLSPAVRMQQGRRWSVEKTDSGVSLTIAHPGGGKARIELNRDEAAGLVNDLKNAL